MPEHYAGRSTEDLDPSGLYDPSPDGPPENLPDPDEGEEERPALEDIAPDLVSDLAKVLDTAALSYGQLTPEAIAVIAKQDRLRQVLVRCQKCRFTCAAQDAELLISIVHESADPWNYVRDVSLLAGDPALQWTRTGNSAAQDYRPVTPKAAPIRTEDVRRRLDTEGGIVTTPYDTDCHGVTISDADSGL